MKKGEKKNNGKGRAAIFFLFVILFVAALVLINALKEDGDAPAQTTTSESAGTTAAEDSAAVTETTSAQTDSDTKIVYTIEEKETVLNIATNSFAKLKYPKFEGYGDVNDEKLNTLIYDGVYSKYRIDLPNLNSMLDEGTTVKYEIYTADVTYMDNLLVSLLFTGQYETKDPKSFMESSPVGFMYSLNIDLKTNSLITADMIFDDFNKLKNDFIGSPFKMVTGIAELFEKTNASDIMIQYRSEYAIYPYVYFNDKSMCFITDLVYSLGSCAVFEVPLNKAPLYINENLSALKELLN